MAYLKPSPICNFMQPFCCNSVLHVWSILPYWWFFLLHDPTPPWASSLQPSLYNQSTKVPMRSRCPLVMHSYTPLPADLGNFSYWSLLMIGFWMSLMDCNWAAKHMVSVVSEFFFSFVIFGCLWLGCEQSVWSPVVIWRRNWMRVGKQNWKRRLQ